jgi:hypothetical protein
MRPQDKAIDSFVVAVESSRPRMRASPDLDGYRMITAAALLMRGLELLADLRRGSEFGPQPLTELGTRSIFEIAVRGRYLLASDNAQDEFVRMCGEFRKGEKRLAQRLGLAPQASLPPLLVSHVREDLKRARDLATLAEELDTLDGYSIDDANSAIRTYARLYGWLSGAAAHAGIATIKRFVAVTGDELHLVDTPDPLTTTATTATSAAWLGELAIAVFEAFAIHTPDLRPIGVHRPPPRVPKP